MKKIVITVLFLMTSVLYAQVAIGKAELTKLADNVTPNPSISLEFGNEYVNSPVSNTSPKGIVFPWVNRTLDTPPYITGYTGTENVVNGTIVYDTYDKKVKIKYPAGWRDLSIDATGVVNTTLQDSLSDLPEAKVMIGGNPDTDNTSGVLVLADSNKAMVLPKVASPHLTIVNPAPGMMVYDTVKKQLAVFNGTVWSFWKP